MSLEGITLRNYRGFAHRGATLPLTHQFVALVGVNNSGKSSLLKSFFEMRPIFSLLGTMDANQPQVNQPFLASAHPLSATVSVPPGERIQTVGHNDLRPRVTLKLHPDTDRDSEPVEFTISLSTPVGNMCNFGVKLANGREFTQCQTVIVTNLDINGQIEPTIQLTRPGGAHAEVRWSPIKQALAQLSDTMYIGAFRNAINAGGGQNYDLQIGNTFVERFAEQKSGNVPSANEAIRQMCVELAGIFGFDSLEVNPTPDRKQITLLVNGRSFRDAEMGAGIMQFVVVAANVLVRSPGFLLIDEPELNLHASLQARFLALLAKYTVHGVVFATHSIGLARSAADHVFVTGRDEEGFRLDPYQSAPTLSSVLGELGYGGRHDPAYRAILLVEGVEDVRVFQQLLAKYGVRGEIAILPLGGDALATGNRAIELAELRRLSDDVYGVVDSERTFAGGDASKRRMEFATACTEQNIEICVTSRRAIENYFTAAAIQQVYGPEAESFGHYERPPTSLSWSKEKNWRVADALSRESLDGTDLGDFLSRLAAAATSE